METPNFARTVEMGLRDLLNEEYERALEHFDAALALAMGGEDEPEAAAIAEAHDGRGVALLHMGQDNEALHAFNRALALDNRSAQLRFNRALAYEALGKQREAMADLNVALSILPNDAEAYFRRAGLNVQLSDFAAAEKDATRAIELHAGTSAAAPVYLVRGLARQQQERADEALQDFATALRFDPNLSEGYYYRALAAMETGDLPQAHDDLQAFLSMAEDPEGEMGQQAAEILAALENDMDVESDHVLDESVGEE